MSTTQPSTPSTLPHQFTGVTALARANIYFGGKVISHTLLMQDGTKKTLNLVYPGRFHFLTDEFATRMEVISGACFIKYDGQNNWDPYSIKGEFTFEVPVRAGFEIEVRSGICEYVCTFIRP
jgi:purine/pyrimidine-nucleoside phosphorylase